MEGIHNLLRFFFVFPDVFDQNADEVGDGFDDQIFIASPDLHQTFDHELEEFPTVFGIDNCVLVCLLHDDYRGFLCLYFDHLAVHFSQELNCREEGELVLGFVQDVLYVLEVLLLVEELHDHLLGLGLLLCRNVNKPCQKYLKISLPNY